MNKIKVVIKAKDKKYIPVYSTEGAAGADLKAAIEDEIELKPNSTLLVPTGIFVELPTGYEMQVRPRSGLAFSHQITVLNTPGTIDEDYRGEIGVILINHSKTSFIIKPEMRIAQLILCPVFQAEFTIKEELTTSIRGEGGFGHTGTN